MSDSKFTAFETDELIALARLDMDEKHYDEALWKLKQVLCEAEPPAEALSMSARLYAQIGLFARARGLYERYMALESDAIPERFQLGMTYLDGGEPTEALAVWEPLLQDVPNFPPALFYRGLALARVGQLDAARKQLDDITRMLPADNLYFGRARELLQELSQAGAAGVAGDAGDTDLLTRQDAYKTVN